MVNTERKEAIGYRKREREIWWVRDFIHNMNSQKVCTILFSATVRRISYLKKKKSRTAGPVQSIRCNRSIDSNVPVRITIGFRIAKKGGSCISLPWLLLRTDALTTNEIEKANAIGRTKNFNFFSFFFKTSQINFGSSRKKPTTIT